MSYDPDQNSTRLSPPHYYLIRLDGISPTTTTTEDIKHFLNPCHVVSVHFSNAHENSPRVCFVKLESENDIDDALAKHRSSIGKKSIEVFRATYHEYQTFIKQYETDALEEPVLRMEGLPGTCTMANIQKLFQGVDIATNGIYISRDMSDNASGGGFVAFIDMDSARRAMENYNRSYIDDSLIELSPSNYEEAKKTMMNDAAINAKRFSDEYQEDQRESNGNQGKSPSRDRSLSLDEDDEVRSMKDQRTPSKSPQPEARQSSKLNHQRNSRSRSPVHRSSTTLNKEYRIKMRGMPFTVRTEDILKFFPSSCRPVRIEILMDRRTKRANGDGYVFFTSRSQVQDAMKCDRKYMGNRYVELYSDIIEKSTSSHDRVKNTDNHRQTSIKTRDTHRHHRSRSRNGRL